MKFGEMTGLIVLCLHELCHLYTFFIFKDDVYIIVILILNYKYIYINIYIYIYIYSYSYVNLG